MLIGHMGLAFIGKRVRPAEPLLWLAIAAFLPDLVRFGLLFIMESSRADVASHSIPSMLILATMSALALRLRCGLWKPALVAALLTISHYGADILTGCKPTWPGGPYVGLGLYHRPLLDLAVEIALVGFSWRWMRTQLPSWSALARGWVMVSLSLVQLLFLLSNCRGGICLVGESIWKWNPDEARWPLRVYEDTYRCVPPQFPQSWHRGG